MKKKLVSALLVTTMAVSLLAGCGGDKASSAGTDGAGAEDTQDAGGGGRCGRGRRRSRAGSSYHSRTRFRNKDGDVVFRRTAQHVLRTDAGKME